MFKTCWAEYKAWLKSQWKAAWLVLRDAVITFVQAIFTWIYSIFASIFMGFWQLVLKPMYVWVKAKLIEWINKI